MADSNGNWKPGISHSLETGGNKAALKIETLNICNTRTGLGKPDE